MITLSGITASSTHLSANEIKITGTSSGIPAGATEYKILLKIESLDGKLFGAPFIDAGAPKSDGTFDFDISGYVDQPVAKTISWPMVGFNNSQPQMLFSISVTPGERYVDEEGNLQESFGSSVSPVFIVKGALPEWRLSELNDAGTNWNDYYCNGRNFLTLMPRTQKVSPYQPVKLWWKSNSASESVTAVTTVYYSDGTSAVHNQEFTALDRLLFEFDISLEHNGILPDQGTKRVEKYTFTIGGETFTFNLDWTPMERYYYLFTDNQIGGIDCIWLSGRLKYEPTGERTIVAKPRKYGAGVKVPGKSVSGNTRTRRWIINSGFKPDESEFLDILLDSPAAWLALPPRNGNRGWNNTAYKVFPVIVQSTNLSLLDDMANNMDNVDLEIIEAY